MSYQQPPQGYPQYPQQPMQPPGYQFQPPQGPYAPPPRKSRKGLWIALAIGLVVVVAFCTIVSVAASSVSTSAGANTSSTTTAPSDSATATTTTSAPKTLLTDKGNGDKTTKAFTASGDWTLNWTCTPSPDVPGAPVFISILTSDGQDAGQGDVTVACKAGATSGSSDVPQGGTYRLKVISGIDWTVKVVG